MTQINWVFSDLIPFRRQTKFGACFQKECKMTQDNLAKVSATDAALGLIKELKIKYGENLLFHQSGGCCDGSSPMCFQTDDYILGDRDVKLGEIGGVPFYMNDDQYEKWKHTDLIIDAVDGIGGMFSLDNGTGKRFLTKSEVCKI